MELLSIPAILRSLSYSSSSILYRAFVFSFVLYDRRSNQCVVDEEMVIASRLTPIFSFRLITMDILVVCHEVGTEMKN